MASLAVMGNSLLDFVMALVRDPEVAARYAADPAGALAAAGLPDVTTADVTSLLPMVTDSLAMSSPGFGIEPTALANAADAANVWASGAATAAFDAFGIAPPPAAEPVISTVGSVEHQDIPAPVEAPSVTDPEVFAVPDLPPHPDPVPPDWADHSGLDAVADPAGHHLADPPGFDLF